MISEILKSAKSVIDMMGREVQVPALPQRIISLVPSQTELLFDLGLAERVAGVTKFCIHPEEQVRQKAMIGGTKNFDLEKIRALQPDLIIGNKEENYQEGIEALAADFPVWMSDILTLEDALHMIRAVGQLTQTEAAAGAITAEISASFSILAPLAPPRKAAYFIWRKPYMVAGRQTFIDDMLGRCGFANVFRERPERYPEVTAEALQEANPELVLLSSEPYPFAEKHLAEFQALLPDAQVRIVDGELFSWYGSRLRHSVTYFRKLIESIS